MRPYSLLVKCNDKENKCFVDPCSVMNLFGCFEMIVKLKGGERRSDMVI